MRSEKSVRTYLRIAVLFLTICVVAHSTRPALALLENLKTAGPNDNVSADVFGATVPTNPISHYYYRGDEPEKFRSAGLDLVFTTRKIEDDRFGIGQYGTVPELTGFFKKKKLFTMTLPDDLARGFPAKAHAVVVRLDPSTKFPQVVFSTHTGGPHCCTITKIATGARSGHWQVLEADKQDAIGYDLEDLDGDGNWELVSIDYSFLYQFTSYGGSRTPIRVSQLRSGQLKNITTNRAFQPEVRKHLAKLEKDAEQEPRLWSEHGFLAAWVATKINLGEGEAAWTKMLANFDRDWDWTLGGCRIERQPGQSPPDRCTYPEALKDHLIKHGYKMNFDGLKME